jgi:hypothetical protein
MVAFPVVSGRSWPVPGPPGTRNGAVGAPSQGDNRDVPGLVYKRHRTRALFVFGKAKRKGPQICASYPPVREHRERSERTPTGAGRSRSQAHREHDGNTAGTLAYTATHNEVASPIHAQRSDSRSAAVDDEFAERVATEFTGDIAERLGMPDGDEPSPCRPCAALARVRQEEGAGRFGPYLGVAAIRHGKWIAPCPPLPQRCTLSAQRAQQGVRDG